MIPTPTPLPNFFEGQELPDLELPDGVAHDMAMQAVQMWNTMNQSDLLTSIQIILVLGIVFITLGVIIYKVRQL